MEINNIKNCQKNNLDQQKTVGQSVVVSNLQKYSNFYKNEYLQNNSFSYNFDIVNGKLSNKYIQNDLQHNKMKMTDKGMYIIFKMQLIFILIDTEKFV